MTLKLLTTLCWDKSGDKMSKDIRLTVKDERRQKWYKKKGKRKEKYRMFHDPNWKKEKISFNIDFTKESCYHELEDVE